MLKYFLGIFCLYDNIKSTERDVLMAGSRLQGHPRKIKLEKIYRTYLDRTLKKVSNTK